LLLLSSRPSLEVNRSLQEGAAARGRELVVADVTRMEALCGDCPTVLLAGAPFPDPGAVLARVGNWRPESALAILETLEARGVPTPNPAWAIRLGRDHWRTVELLARRGLPVAPTLAGSEPELLAATAVEKLGLPVVVKQRRSRMGVGVILCEDRDHLEAVLDSLWRMGDEVVVQAFVASGGVSHRVLVVGGRPVAAARFSARQGEWRSNAARGGVVEPWRPDTSAEDLAMAAAGALGLDIAAVDLLPTPQGFLVAEVNPSPGFKALEEATGADVAGAIVERMVRMAGE